MILLSRAMRRASDLGALHCRSKILGAPPMQTRCSQKLGSIHAKRRRASPRSLVIRLAGRPPNFNNGSFDFGSLDIDEESVELAQSALPVLFGLLAFGFLYPLGGIPLSGALVVGVGGTLGVALSSGFLSKIERKLGISSAQSALAIVGVVFAIFAVPAVLRFGFFLLAIGAAANLVTMLVNPDGLSGRMPGGFDDTSPFTTQTGRNQNNYGDSNFNNFSSRPGAGGMGSSARRDVGKTIDVEWETVDD